MKNTPTAQAVNHAARIISFVIRDKSRAKQIETEINSGTYSSIDDVMFKIRQLVGDMPGMSKYIQNAKQALELHSTLK